MKMFIIIFCICLYISIYIFYYIFPLFFPDLYFCLLIILFPKCKLNCLFFYVFQNNVFIECSKVNSIFIFVFRRLPSAPSELCEMLKAFRSHSLSVSWDNL